MSSEQRRYIRAAGHVWDVSLEDAQRMALNSAFFSGVWSVSDPRFQYADAGSSRASAVTLQLDKMDARLRHLLADDVEPVVENTIQVLRLSAEQLYRETLGDAGASERFAPTYAQALRIHALLRFLGASEQHCKFMLLYLERLLEQVPCALGDVWDELLPLFLESEGEAGVARVVRLLSADGEEPQFRDRLFRALDFPLERHLAPDSAAALPDTQLEFIGARRLFLNPAAAPWSADPQGARLQWCATATVAASTSEASVVQAGGLEEEEHESDERKDGARSAAPPSEALSRGGQTLSPPAALLSRWSERPFRCCSATEFWRRLDTFSFGLLYEYLGSDERRSQHFCLAGGLLSMLSQEHVCPEVLAEIRHSDMDVWLFGDQDPHEVASQWAAALVDAKGERARRYRTGYRFSTALRRRGVVVDLHVRAEPRENTAYASARRQEFFEPVDAEWTVLERTFQFIATGSFTAANLVLSFDLHHLQWYWEPLPQRQWFKNLFHESAEEGIEKYKRANPDVEMVTVWSNGSATAYPYVWRCTKQAWLASHTRVSGADVNSVEHLRAARALARGFHVALRSEACLAQSANSSCWSNSERAPSTAEELLSALKSFRAARTNTNSTAIVDILTERQREDSWNEFAEIVKEAPPLNAEKRFPLFCSQDAAAIRLGREGEAGAEVNADRHVLEKLDASTRIGDGAVLCGKEAQHAWKTRAEVLFAGHSEYGMMLLAKKGAPVHPRFWSPQGESNAQKLVSLFQLRCSRAPLYDYRSVDAMLQKGGSLVSLEYLTGRSVRGLSRPFRIELPPLKIALETLTAWLGCKLQLYTPCSDAWVQQPGLRALLRCLTALQRLPAALFDEKYAEVRGLQLEKLWRKDAIYGTEHQLPLYCSSPEDVPVRRLMQSNVNGEARCDPLSEWNAWAKSGKLRSLHSLQQEAVQLGKSDAACGSFSGWARVTVQFDGFDEYYWHYSVTSVQECVAPPESRCSCCEPSGRRSGVRRAIAACEDEKEAEREGEEESVSGAKSRRIEL